LAYPDKDFVNILPQYEFLIRFSGAIFILGLIVLFLLGKW